MIRRLLHIPLYYLVLAALFYLAAAAVEAYFLSRFPTFTRHDLGFAAILHSILIIAFIVFGIARFFRFHSIINKHYLDWLQTSPWTHRQPLPLGPILLAWQDLLLLIPAFLLARFHLHFPGPAPVIAFLAAYIASATAAQFLTHPHPSIALVLILLPLISPLLEYQWILLALLAALYPVAVLATQRSLRHFPWKADQPKSPPDAGTLFTRIGPVESSPSAPLPAAFALSLLAGWWTFCLALPLQFVPNQEFFSTFLAGTLLVGFILALVRLATYCGSHFPPITILGRLATGRLIIPRYDIVFLAPLLTVILSFLIPLLLLLNLSPPLVAAIITSALLFTTLAPGPSLHRWKLTAPARIPHPRQPPTAPAQQSIQLTLAKSS